MQHNPINWFEIPIYDVNRAKNFYESVFNCKLTPSETNEAKTLHFPMQDNTYGAGGMLIKMDGYIPSQDGTTVYFSVDDIDKTLKKVATNKGKTLAPKTSIGEYGFMAYFEDSEGNKIALHCMT